MPDCCLSSALAFPSDLGARRPCRGLRGWGCAHCQSLPRGELFPVFCEAFLLPWLPLWNTCCRRTGCSSCGLSGSSAVAHGLSALWHVGSSQTRDATHVSCICRWILYQVTREARGLFLPSISSIHNVLGVLTPFVPNLTPISTNKPNPKSDISLHLTHPPA